MKFSSHFRIPASESARVASRVVYGNNILWNIACNIAASDDVRRDIVINLVLTCHKLSLLIRKFEVKDLRYYFFPKIALFPES